MNTHSDLDSLVHEIEYSKHIGIDGLDGIGKTTLAKNLHEITKHPTFHLDEYLERNQDGYVEHIKEKELLADISRSPTYIIEGVCLLEIISKLDTANIPRQTHLYKKNERPKVG